MLVKECKNFNSLKASKGDFTDHILLRWELPCKEMYYMNIYRSKYPDRDFFHLHRIEKDTLTHRQDYTYKDFGLCPQFYNSECNIKLEPGKTYYYYVTTSPYLDDKHIGEVKSNIAEGYIKY